MEEININSYAKINLSIDVLGIRENGYHEVLMVMQQIELYDVVTVKWELLDAQNANDESPNSLINKEDENQAVSIFLTTSLTSLPIDQTNLAYKAAALMIRKYGEGKRGRLSININKNIPVSAGLAGGSGNGAAVILAINKLWKLNLTLEQLFETGKILGADVSFCLAGQAALNKELNMSKDPMAGTCALASGIGEELKIIKPLKSYILLSKPPMSLSTVEVYKGIDNTEISAHPDTQELVQGLEQNNFQKISKNMINVLENYSLKEYPIIMYTKNKIEAEGKAYKALMSGSGPTVFGLYTNRKKGARAFNILKQINKETFFTKTL